MPDVLPLAAEPSDALDVIVFEDPTESAWPRLHASLCQQDPAVMGEVFRLPGIGPFNTSGALYDRFDPPTIAGLAPWILSLSESDLLAPNSLTALGTLLNAVDHDVSLVRLHLVPARGAEPIAERLLWRRPPSAPRDRGEQERAQVMEFSERLLAPLGLLDSPAQPNCRSPRTWMWSTSWPEPSETAIGAAPDAGWDLGALRQVAAAGGPWVLVAARGWEASQAAKDAPRRVGLLLADGASAVALCRGAERQPSWSRRSVAVGERIALVALVCRRADLRQALEARDATAVELDRHALSASASPSPSAVIEVLEEILARSGGRGTGCSYHHAGGAGRSDEVTLAVTVPAAATNVTGDVVAPPTSGAGPRFASRSVLPLELVFDVLNRRLLLSSPLTLLPADAYPERVVIGAVDALAFPGTEAVMAVAGASVQLGPLPIEYPVDQDTRLEFLGYFPRGALNDCASLFHAGEQGKAALRRRFKRDVSHLSVPGSDLQLMVYRMSDQQADPSPIHEAESVVINIGAAGPAGSGTVPFCHPDAIGVAHQAGLEVRRGPSIAVRPTPQTRPLRAPYGLVGFVRAAPHPGDTTEIDADGPWSGLAPTVDRVPLLRWDSNDGPRYSSGGRPRGVGGEEDPSVRFVHTLGWLRPHPESAHGHAHGGGVAGLFEWYHPQRRRWAYGSDPVEKVAGGFQRVGVIGGLDLHPGPNHVPLYRSRVRPWGGEILHAVQNEVGAGIGERLAGWMVAAWSARSATLIPPVACGTGQAHIGLGASPFPGAMPLFELARAGRPDERSTDPAPMLADGWSIRAVVGYVPAGSGPAEDIAWLLSTLGLPMGAAPSGSGRGLHRFRRGSVADLCEAARFAVRVLRKVGGARR